MTAKRALTPRALMKAAAGKTFGGAYLLYGPDEYIKSETIRMTVGAHVPPSERSFAVSHLMGSQTDTREILTAARAVPMLGERLAIVVHDAHRLAAAHKSRLPAALPDVAHPALLIFSGPERIDRRTQFYKWFTDHGRAVACDALTAKQAETFAQRQFAAAGKTADDLVVGRLLARVGSDAGRLAREVEKLAIYAGERDVLTVDDVETVAGHSLESSPEQLFEAVLSGQRQRALYVARVLQAAGLDAGALIGRLTAHAVDLLRAAAARAPDPWKLAGALRLPAVRAQELSRWLKQTRREQVVTMVTHLADAESLVRSGRADPEAVWTTLLLALCGDTSGARRT